MIELDYGEIVEVIDFSDKLDGADHLMYVGRTTSSLAVNIKIDWAFIGEHLINLGYPTSYINAIQLLSFKKIPGYSRRLTIPTEFIKKTGKKIIDARKLPEEAKEYIVRSLYDIHLGRRLAYNVHCMNIGGGIKGGKIRDIEWYAEHGLHFFQPEKPSELVKTLIDLGWASGSLLMCSHCDHRLDKTSFIREAFTRVTFKGGKTKGIFGDLGRLVCFCPSCESYLEMVQSDDDYYRLRLKRLNESEHKELFG